MRVQCLSIESPWIPASNNHGADSGVRLQNNLNRLGLDLIGASFQVEFQIS